MERLLAVLLIVLLLPSLSVVASSTEDVMIQYEAGYYGRLDIVNISNKIRVLDANDYSKHINEESFGYYPGVEFVTDYLEVKSPTTLTIGSNGVELYAYKLKNNKGKLEYDSRAEFPMEGKIEYYLANPDDYDDSLELIIDMNEEIPRKYLDKYAIDGRPTPIKGAKMKIDKPGDYIISTIVGGLETSNIYLKVVEQAPTKTQTKVNPNSSKVLVNGKETSFDAYNIDGSNYFKLRDLAMVVSGTEKQFEVSWNNEKKVIDLIANKAYTKVGGELVKGDGKAKVAAENTSAIYKDGKEIKLKAYTIGGNNYFKLRDVAQAFNIGVTWDEITKTIGIDTTKGYEIDSSAKNSELAVKSVEAVSPGQIKITFEMPITEEQAGDYYSSITLLGRDGAPWEVGRTLNLKKGQEAIISDISEEHETFFSEAGEYEFYISNKRGDDIFIEFSVSEDFIIKR